MNHGRDKLIKQLLFCEFTSDFQLKLLTNIFEHLLTVAHEKRDASAATGRSDDDDAARCF